MTLKINMDNIPTTPNKVHYGLTVIEKTAIEKLPIGLQKFVLAKESEKISELRKADAIKFLYKSIAEVAVNIGWIELSADKLMVENMAVSSYDLILDKHSTLTTSELKLAFMNGSLEYYGKNTVFSFKMLSDWLKGYSNDELKKKAMAEFNRLLELVKVKPELTLEEKEQNTLILCLEFFSDYKNKEMIRQYITPVNKVCRIYYDLLVGKGLINYSKEQLNGFKAKAEQIYLAEISQSKVSRQISRTEYESLMSSMVSDNKPLKNLRGKLALLSYFDELILNGKDLNEIIKN